MRVTTSNVACFAYVLSNPSYIALTFFGEPYLHAPSWPHWFILDIVPKPGTLGRVEGGGCMGRIFEHASRSCFRAAVHAHAMVEGSALCLLDIGAS